MPPPLSPGAAFPRLLPQHSGHLPCSLDWPPCLESALQPSFCDYLKLTDPDLATQTQVSDPDHGLGLFLVSPTSSWGQQLE